MLCATVDIAGCHVSRFGPIALACVLCSLHVFNPQNIQHDHLSVKFACVTVYNVILADVDSLMATSELDMGRVHPRVGSGQVGSSCAGLCGSPWIIQNVTLSVIVKFTLSQIVVCLPTNCAGRQRSLSSVCLSADWQ